MIKKILAAIGLSAISFLVANLAWAHAVVSPNQVGIGKFQTFSLGVPSEKDSNTVGVRLVIPEGLAFVTPNVKPVWKIDVKKTGAGEDAIVSEINWTGGSIPSGQRDEFVFSAKVPTMATTLNWKVYQTYVDGSVMSWDQTPSSEEMTDKGPYSQTQVVNDLAPAASASAPTNKYNFLLVISIAALILSVAALAVGLKQKAS